MTACSCRCTGATSSRGSKGDAGATGSQGEFGGFSGSWLFSTSTAVTPAATFLRLNNATPSSVTEIYVSDTNADSIDYDAFLDSFSNDSKYGYIRIFKEADNTKYCTYRVTAVTDNGADHTLTVTYISSNSTFAASDPLVLTFSPSGPSGTSVLYNTTTAVATTNGAMTVLQSYTLAINQLATDGDMVEITADFDTDGVTQAKAIDLRIGGTVCHTKVTEFRQTMQQKASRFIVRITRQSTTTLFITFHHINSNTVYQTTGDGRLFFETGFSVSDLSANTTALQIRGHNIDGAPTETINCTQMVVMYYKK